MISAIISDKFYFTINLNREKENSCVYRFFKAAVASLLALLQLLTLVIKISQEQWKLQYLIANIVAFPKIAL